MQTHPAGPLDGIRVLELGTLLAGPFAARLLADLGAEVIKVEAPDRPDPVREWGNGTVGERRLWWPTHSRNKKCVTLDLRRPEGQALCLRLVERCDAVIENFRPGTLERWNLGFERLNEVRPGVVCVRISGYGQDGPYRDRAGYASVAEAMSGLRHLNGFPGQAPPRLGISLGDSLGALFAVQGLLAALYRRDARGGAGQIVDVSLVESCFALLESVPAEYAALGLVREPTGTRLDGIAPSNIFRSRDGRWVVIAANQDTVFGRLCDAMGRPDLAHDERFASHDARGGHQDELEAIIGEWAAGHDALELDAILNDAGVAAGLVYTIEDIFADPHFRAREMVVEHDDPEIGPVAGPNVFPRFSDTPGTIRWTGPWDPGAHNRDVYGELAGLDEAELTELERAGVI
jgi:formyl-CoA transferase